MGQTLISHDVAQDGTRQARVHESDFVMSPGNIRAVAHLCGMDGTAPVEHARVLALACGTGEALLPFALAYPQAQIVGIDLWPDELDQGRREAEALGITNLTLLPLLYTDIDPSFGTFDYIIVHDEYAWAPEVVREAIWRICADNLAPHGVAYVGYPCAPGWRALDVVRDAIQLHAHSAGSIEDIRAHAAAMLGMLTEGMDVQAPGAAHIQAAARRLLSHPEYYISADFLQRPSNAPYFVDVLNEAQRAGLAYVGDAQPDSEWLSAQQPSVQLQNSLLAFGQVRSVRQQYLDFAVNRPFRRSLFVHEAHAAAVAAGPVRERLAQLNVACHLRRKQSLKSPAQSQTVFINPTQQTFAFSDEMVIAVCDALAAVWPHTLDFNALVAATAYVLPGDDASSRQDAVLSALDDLLGSGQLRCQLGPGPYDANADTPISVLGNTTDVAAVRFNLWGDSKRVAVEPSAAPMLEKLAQLSDNGLEGLTVDQAFAGFIDHLNWHGLLTGSSLSWNSFFGAMLASRDEQNDDIKLHLLANYVAHGRKVVDAGQGALLPSRRAGRLNPPAELVSEMLRLLKQSRLDKLEATAGQFIQRFPAHEFGWYMRALLKQMQRDRAGAVDAVFQALARRGDDASFFVILTSNLPDFPSSWLTIRLLGLALWIKPDDVLAYVNLGNAYRRFGDKSRALRGHQHALVLEPGRVTAQKMVGILHGDLGQIEQSIEVLRGCAMREPDDLETYSNYLYYLSMSDQIDPQAQFEEHLKYGRQVKRLARKAGLTLVHQNSREPGRRLRVGFVSGDLYNHAVARFVEPIWREIDRSAFELYAYSASAEEDSTTRQLHRLVDHWAHVKWETNEQLARRIHADGIDILFDLSGHTGNNRLPMFAMKPAPIQVSWIGYPGTTGMEAMDYYIINRYIAPEGMDVIEKQFTEKLLRLTATASFDYSSQDPAVNELPALSGRGFTFGSFNRINKVSPRMFRVWSDILKAVPDSRLLMGHIETSSFKPLRDLFASHGISEDRLVLQSRTTMHQYLSLHHEVDLLLDTFPYNGGTTTCYGLWMGVPTLTLAGQSIPSRTGVAVMGPLGLDAFIANSEEEYLQKAVAWTGRLPELAALRQTARGLLSEGSIMSRTAVTRSLEQAMRRVWENWCDGQPATHFSFD